MNMQIWVSNIWSTSYTSLQYASLGHTSSSATLKCSMSYICLAEPSLFSLSLSNLQVSQWTQSAGLLLTLTEQISQPMSCWNIPGGLSRQDNLGNWSVLCINDFHLQEPGRDYERPQQEVRSHIREACFTKCAAALLLYLPLSEHDACARQRRLAITVASCRLWTSSRQRVRVQPWTGCAPLCCTTRINLRPW